MQLCPYLILLVLQFVIGLFQLIDPPLPLEQDVFESVDDALVAFQYGIFLFDDFELSLQALLELF